VPYDLIFNDKVLPILKSPDMTGALTDYVTRLDELLRESRFFSRESFSYYNAEKVATSLGDNGFFSAGHTVLLNGKEGEPVTIGKRAELESLIAAEHERITDDESIRKSLDAVRRALTKNKEARDFHQYIADHPALLPELGDVEALRRKLWISYLKAQESLCARVISRYQITQQRDQEIERQAASERTRWEQVIDIFNDRFSVPFKLTAKNHSRVVLGRDKFLELGFEFADGEERTVVQRGDLLKVLSNGEKKALYILNVLFEVEARRASGRETLFIIDDIAESFDYKNKYAIIQYLKEMTEDENFRLVILTHNFDFFRTLESRKVVRYSSCMMAERH
jgi:wobble nucleotide-excising tRNase